MTETHFEIFQWVNVPLLAFIFGALIGSFLNVVVYRLPRRKSIAFPPSACSSCNVLISRYDNIPILSWLLLRGRCRSCKASISPRYIYVEVSTAALFALITWKFPPKSLVTGIDLVALLYLASISIALALIDLETHTLPNRIVLPSYLVGAVLMGASAIARGDFYPFERGLLGAAVMWSSYFLMAMAYGGGMGFGDVKTAGALGLFLGYLGWKVLIVGAFSAFILGGVFALALIATKKVKLRSGIPFGPWMLIGAWIGIFLGGVIAEGYSNLFGFTQVM